MEADFPGIPRTSSNLGICTFAAEGDRFKVELLDLARSSIESEKAATGAELEAWAAARGGSFERLSEAPAWKPEPGSALLSLAKEAFQAVRDKEPELLVTHGGLECGLFRPVYPQWEMISFGPTIRAPHSPNEAAFLPSMPRFWAFLLELLARL
jgi:dipeptidase D